MRHIRQFFTILSLAGTLVLFFSCGNQETSDSSATKDTSNINESALLLDFIAKSGDIINSEQAPFLVPAADVYENIKNYLVIDIRDTSEYEDGHIDGAILVNTKDIINYLDKKANTGAYEKVVLACHTGQTASYYTTLLHLIGFTNVYALKFGMSGWSKEISPNKIVNSLSNKYAGILSRDSVGSIKQYDFPTIKTGQSGGYSILTTRANEIANLGFGKVKINIDTLMQNPDKYYIINYFTKEQYSKGHLPGAVLFEPRKSFIKDVMLKYLPTNKPIVVYCLSGQTSASVVAYLRVLGYNAFTLSLGANAFMHDFVQSYNDKAFNPLRDIANYELVGGKNPSIQNATTAHTSTSTADKEIKTPVVKKKQKSGGGGGC